MFSNEKINQLAQYLDTVDEKSRIYLGCDSVKFKKHGKWFAAYTLVAVVHINNQNGCRVFSTTVTEPDFDQRKDRPALRLMNEAMKCADLFNQISPLLAGREVEIHLDISPDPTDGSNCVLDQAVGYIRGTTNVDPKVKPNSWAATHVADRGGWLNH